MERRKLLEVLFLLTGVSSCLANEKIDLGFLVDGWPTSSSKPTSKSTEKGVESVKDLIREIYGHFPIDEDKVHIGLVKSGLTAKVVFDFNAYKDLDSLDEAVDEFAFPRDADSHMGKALDLANHGLFENSGRPDAVKILVVVAQTKSSDDVNRAARDLRNSGVNILSAWYTKSGAHGDDLKSIVSPPKHYNLFRDDSSLENLAEHIVKRIRYVAANNGHPTAAPTAHAKQHSQKDRCSKKCDVEVSGGEKVEINCKNCKLVGCCNRCCKRDISQPFYPGPVELAILLDESGELKSWNNFNSMKSFIKNITREFELKNKKTRIGIISFTDDNLQLFDLHSYHDNKNVDNQIDKLNYEGIGANSGALNKALDATQTNFFTEDRDLSVPRILLVFDSGARKDDQTEVKAFKLQGTDVQTFCIGLGTTYDKTECKKVVEKPYQRHSLAAQVGHLGELQDSIMLMIVSDIAGKYCPVCAQGTSEACRPCKTARRYIGKEDSNSLPNIHSDKSPKLVELENLQNYHTKLGNDRDDDVGGGGDEIKSEPIPVKLVSGTQVGTPLPSVSLVKDLLHGGTALNSDSSTQLPLIADGQANSLGTSEQGLLSAQPALLSQQQLVQSLQQQLAQPLQQQLAQPLQQQLAQPLQQQLAQPLQQQLAQPLQLQEFVQQELPQQQLGNLNNVLPQSAQAGIPLSVDPKLLSTLLKKSPADPSATAQLFSSGNTNQGETTDHPFMAQPIVLNPSLLSQALLGGGKFQRQHSGKSETAQAENSDKSSSLNDLLLSANSKFADSDSGIINKLASSKDDAGMTSSFPSASLPLGDEDNSNEALFQSSMPLTQFEGPMQLTSPTEKANWMGFPQTTAANKKSPFEDEYKYDNLSDQGGSFVMGCKDLSDECASYATEGGCDEFAPLSPIGDVRTMCKNSCGFCESGTAETGRKRSKTKIKKRKGHKRKLKAVRKRLHQRTHKHG